MNRIQILEAIERERLRQLTVKGYDAEHDKEHDAGELAMAAACYAAAPATIFTVETLAAGLPVRPVWPFVDAGVKHGNDRRRQLIIAAALIVAELERLEESR